MLNTAQVWLFFGDSLAKFDKFPTRELIRSSDTDRRKANGILFNIFSTLDKIVTKKFHQLYDLEAFS